ncbi:MAG: transcriptional repressor [Tissierellia bacterium]|nr:Fur family transcriptional regulator [Bacillota bacterium]NLL23517.1 transcriptional repressor [Tissierellia bacterium]
MSLQKLPSSTKKIEQQLTDTLRRFGLKWTRPRRLVFELLVQADHHLSAEEIYEALAKIEPSTAISTVYRTVRLLEDLGFLAGVDLGDGMRRYEWVHCRTLHHHLVCTECLGVEEVSAEVLLELREIIFQESGFCLDEREVTFTGICNKCRNKE